MLHVGHVAPYAATSNEAYRWWLRHSRCRSTPSTSTPSTSSPPK